MNSYKQKKPDKDKNTPDISGLVKEEQGLEES